MAELIEGLGDLREIFKDINADVRTKAARRIVAAGAGELRKEAKAIVTRLGLIKSRALINNIAIKRERNAPAGVEQYNLGVRHGRDLGRKAVKYLAVGRRGRIVTRYENDPYYWRFLEFGHRIVSRAAADGFITRRQKDGKWRTSAKGGIANRRRSPTGFVEKTPFIRPALENKRSEALAAMERQAKRIVERQNR